MKMLLNILIYQATWLLCVLGETRGAVLALPLLGLHLFLSEKRKADLQIMVMFLAAGLIIDGTLSGVGFFSFAQPATPIPFWLAVIWLALAILPHNSLAWLKERPLLSALFGAIGGPLAYWAGVRLGVADFNWPLLPSLLLLAVVWAILWTGAMYFAGRMVPGSGQLSNQFFQEEN